MKKAAVLAILFASCNAFAEWSFLVANESKTHSFYIDYSTVKPGPRPRAWFLDDLDAPSKYGDRSNKQLIEVDCLGDMTRVLSMVFMTGNMGSGSVSTFIDRPTDWSHVAPGTIDSVILGALCKKKR